MLGPNEPEKAAQVQSQATELAMLLCLPAALRLAVSAGPLISALFQGGRFTADDAHLTAITLSIVVLGLPAYVLVKVLTPGFYARQDTATPVKIACIVLVATVVLNFLLIPPFGIAGLASAIAICSWLNCLMLYVVLHRRGHFRIAGWLASRVARQMIACVGMAVALYAIRLMIADWFTGSPGKRLVASSRSLGAAWRSISRSSGPRGHSTRKS